MHDVIVVGAGLAGLRCAGLLSARGLDVVVLEAADAVGGRQRTDIVDGFRLDRGFQVLNPAYPALRRSIDLDALALGSFPVGVRVRTTDGMAELRHPLRYPSSIAASLRSGLVSGRDAVALARWAAPAFVRPLARLARNDVSLREGWEAAGLRGPLRTAVLEPFLAGVLAEGRGATSNAFARLLVRYFALGRPGLPAQGIAAVPEQLAAHARTAGTDIRLGARAERMTALGESFRVELSDGDPVVASRVVVAVGPDDVAGLTGLPVPTTNGLQTWWFAAAEPPTGSALLTVDGRGRGPVVNTVVMTHTVPSYAPAGRHLIAATCLLPRGGDPTEEVDVRRHLREIWGADVSAWELMRRDDIPHALPAQPAPLGAPRSPRYAERLYIAGDHRGTASIQGALTSGERAAHAILTDTRLSSSGTSLHG
ncbi:FAD-dependent oxidoreductase [Microbacterium phyllosphaerae]|uniref:FAD-dependent oxidoreductase n=1 Tax=Microbacterium phyllosphaerae TaxID=124798 RepID=UPI002169AF0A|nr:FAD-dependent oxidoreductase [Microbacterium phyllosphaerae]MCS3444428.1 phytoene dehydrogenase-like protein [Microbacterium phyllosphaerae]